MNRPYLNKSLFFLLIIALLTAQWASAHIHVGAHHEHDGSHHQHASEGHTYHPASHHADNIDVPHVPTDYDVVELEHNCTSPSWNKLDDLPDACFPLIYRSLQPSLAGTATPLDSVSQRPPWLSYATVRPRAPPLAAR